MKIRISLKDKLIIMVAVAIIIFGYLAVYFVFNFSRQSLKEKSQENLELLANRQTIVIGEIFEQTKTMARTIAFQPFIADYFEGEKKLQDKKVLEHLNGYNIGGYFSAIYLMDVDGKTLVSTDSAFVGNNYSFRDYFIDAIGGQAGFSVQIGVTSNVLGYYFSAPIKSKDGLITGVVVAKLSPDLVNGTLDSSPNSLKGMGTMLVDYNGIVLYSNKNERLFHSLGGLSQQDSAEIAKKNTFAGLDIKPLMYDDIQQDIGKIEKIKFYKLFDRADNEEEAVIMARVLNYPIFIFIEVGVKEFVSDSSKIATLLAMFVLVAMFVCVLIIFIVLTIFFRPLQKLKKFADSVGTSDVVQKLDIKTGDELEDLADKFNQMSERIYNNVRETEKKIKEQTKEINTKADDLEKQKAAILNVLEDVEEEKSRSELLAQDLEKFKLAVDNASDQVVITDVEGMVVYGNKAVEDITGYKPQEAIGKKAGALWRLPMELTYYQRLWDIIKKQKKTFIDEIQNKRKNGQVYTAKISISPVLDAGGKIIYFVGIERDISREKEIDKAKTEFVSLASHQLRTPLSAINWYTEMLLAGDAGQINEEQKKYLQEVATGNQRMVDLVNALLNVSRLELGTFVVEPEMTDIVKLAKSAADEQRQQIKIKKLKFNEKYEAKLPQMSVDPKLLRMVFQNLLSNAIKYTPENGKITLEISLLKKSISVKISDTGYGITESQQDKIFSKLFRADNVREKDTEGTGLGLYIVKAIIDHSGGRIWFESQENKGTTFYIDLPLSGMKKKAGTKSLG